MGKGDKKSRRGKLFKGSYGVRRQQKNKTAAIPVKSAPEVPKAAKEAKVIKEESKPVSQIKEIKETRSIATPKTVKAAAPAKKDVKPKKTES